MAANSNETPVTGVHWNPTIPTMMASVNDDGEIRIWGSASKLLNVEYDVLGDTLKAFSLHFCFATATSVSLSNMGCLNHFGAQNAVDLQDEWDDC